MYVSIKSNGNIKKQSYKKTEEMPNSSTVLETVSLSMDSEGYHLWQGYLYVKMNESGYLCLMPLSIQIRKRFLLQFLAHQATFC